ncbi:Arabinanolytic transcriptional activator araR [Lasiodiplodia theobromae]|uniref:Arabinanolytic transcriptional activator araR n=2 Tax=Lasiodiplodia theobromae TaxID=45133 RepID=A0A5N5DXP1_9PEZI|nr:Arabinanolytic transcriptional activator araR [Lasiodiplodia theobromae]
MAAHLDFDFGGIPGLAASMPALPEQPQLQASSSSAKQPIPLACVACRSKHLKCSGGEPCSRCATDGSECSYIKSRRGYKGPRKRTAGDQMGRPSPREPRPDQPACTAGLAATAGISASPPEQQHEQSPSFPALEVLTGSDQSPSSDQFNSFAFQSADGMAVGAQSQVTMAPKLVGHLLGDCSSLSNMVCGAFFTFFAPAHPFLMPRSYLLDFLCNGGTKRQPHLEMAIQFIGSCYVPQASPQLLEEALRHTLFQQGLPRDSFMVQALLLYAIGLKANDRSIMADEMLSKAIEIALAIGMNDRDFAIRNGCGNRVLEESWRRTWWELYIADGFFAGVSQRTNFRLRDVQTDVPLPCEEDEYGSGYIPLSKTLEEYDDSAFAEDDVEYSSFAYRIDSVRNLGRVLAVSSEDVLDFRAIECADSHLVNWSLHLPNSKREPISHDGQLDHMIFQAHMITDASTILLHKPRSTLDEYRSADEIRTCVKQCAPLVSTQSRETHTAKCTEAARRLSQLVRVMHPILPLTKLTPFFTCAIVMASVVHLSAWSLVPPNGGSSGTAGGICGSGSGSNSNNNNNGGAALLQDCSSFSSSADAVAAGVVSGPDADAVLKELIRLSMGALKQLAAQWPLAKTAAGQVRGVAGELFRAKREVRRLWNEVAAEDILRMIEDAASESGGSGSGASGGAFAEVGGCGAA